MSHVWHWRSRLPERKGMPCRMLARGKMNSVLVEFADGQRVVTSRFAVRKRRQRSVLEMIRELRAAGLDAWDKIDDPVAYLREMRE